MIHIGDQTLDVGVLMEMSVIGMLAYVLFKIHLHLPFQETIIFVHPIKY